MQNTPAGCGSHLPSILRTFKNDPKSRSVNNFLECSDLDPNSGKDLFYQPELRLGKDLVDRIVELAKNCDNDKLKVKFLLEVVNDDQFWPACSAPAKKLLQQYRGVDSAVDDDEAEQVV